MPNYTAVSTGEDARGLDPTGQSEVQPTSTDAEDLACDLSQRPDRLDHDRLLADNDHHKLNEVAIMRGEEFNQPPYGELRAEDSLEEVGATCPTAEGATDELGHLLCDPERDRIITPADSTITLVTKDELAMAKTDPALVLVERRELARKQGKLLSDAGQPNVILTPAPNVHKLAKAMLATLSERGTSVRVNY